MFNGFASAGEPRPFSTKLALALAGVLLATLIAQTIAAAQVTTGQAGPGAPTKLVPLVPSVPLQGTQGTERNSPSAINSPQGVSQLLGNAGFESGAWSPWQIFGAPTLDSSVKHGGATSAHLGNADNANDQVFQAVAIPANASAAALDFWYRLATNEAYPNSDFFCYGLWHQSGSTAYVQRCIDLGATGNRDWTRETYNLTASELISVTGQTVVAGFLVQTDQLLTSRAWVDDTALNVTTPTPSPNHKVYLPSVMIARGSPPVITSFAANPATIAPGGSSTLSWNVTGATSLSISPGIGAVTGSSVNVQPATTTEYTLIATNAFGSTSAKTTITIGDGGGGDEGALWLPYTINDNQPLPTYGTSVAVDGNGGIHAAYAIYIGATWDQRHASYAYCPAGCADKANWTRIKLGAQVQDVRVVVDPAGRPRMMLAERNPDLDPDFGAAYQYAECNDGCANPANWTITTLATALDGFATREDNNNDYFAVDRQGRLAFVYTDYTENHYGTFYATCAAACANTGSWSETKLTNNTKFFMPSLAFSPSGQPQLAFGLTYGEDWYPSLTYLQCDSQCENAANWHAVRFHQIHGSARFSLQIDGNGRPRLALYTGSYAIPELETHHLYYLWCDTDCISSANWWRGDIALPTLVGGGIDMALDQQNRPRISYLNADGLSYAWCNANCESGNATWQRRVVESNASLADNYEVLPIHHCTISAWINGRRTSLALDAAGNPRFGYDAQHMWSGVYVDRPWENCQITDVTMTRAALINQP